MGVRVYLIGEELKLPKPPTQTSRHRRFERNGKSANNKMQKVQQITGYFPF
jgi:hypothetical protein